MRLRSGPGTVHAIVSRYEEGTAFAVVGKAPGGEWLKVEMPDSRYGWMLQTFLRLDGDIGTLPFIEITDSIIITGKVLDQNGEPVNAINMALIQREGEESMRTDAFSTQDGTFYAYLPLDSQPPWTVQVVGVGCTSRIMDADCKHSGTFDPAVITLEALPPSKEIVFTYLADQEP